MKKSLKQVIVVRKELEMGKGKLATEVAHASFGAARLADEKTVKKWEGFAKKIVLKVESQKELKDIYKEAKKGKLPCFLVKDAGLTQLKSGTVTAVGIGPAEEKKIDKITGKLKLL